jgi:hypothetical protein
LGVQATLLHVGDERTGVVTGNDAAPEAVLMLEIGSRRVAREHFRHPSPTEGELEHAIATIEDQVARVRPMLRNRSTLYHLQFASINVEVPPTPMEPMAIEERRSS